MIAIHPNSGRDAGCETISQRVITATSAPAIGVHSPASSSTPSKVTQGADSRGCERACLTEGRDTVIHQGTAGRQTQQQQSDPGRTVREG